jgi:hypothetical protein
LILGNNGGINQVYIDAIMVIGFSRMLVGIDGSGESMGEAEYAVSILKGYKDILFILVLILKLGIFL